MCERCTPNNVEAHLSHVTGIPRDNISTFISNNFDRDICLKLIELVNKNYEIFQEQVAPPEALTNLDLVEILYGFFSAMGIMATTNLETLQAWHEELLNARDGQNN